MFSWYYLIFHKTGRQYFFISCFLIIQNLQKFLVFLEHTFIIYTERNYQFKNYLNFPSVSTTTLFFFILVYPRAKTNNSTKLLLQNVVRWSPHSVKAKNSKYFCILLLLISLFSTTTGFTSFIEVLKDGFLLEKHF